MKGLPPAEILPFGLITIARVAPEQVMFTFVFTFGKVASIAGSTTTGCPMIFIDFASWHSTSTFCALRKFRLSKTIFCATTATSVAIPRIFSRSFTNFIHSFTVFRSIAFDASFMTYSVSYSRGIYRMRGMDSRGGMTKQRMGESTKQRMGESTKQRMGESTNQRMGESTK